MTVYHKSNGSKLWVVYSVNSATELNSNIWLLAIPDSISEGQIAEISGKSSQCGDDAAEALIKLGAVSIEFNEMGV